MVQSEMPERHHHGFPGSTGVTSKPAGSEELLHHIGDQAALRTLSSGAAGTAAVTPGLPAAGAAAAQRAAAPLIGLQATGRPPSARYEAICQSPFRYSPAALRSGFRRK